MGRYVYCGGESVWKYWFGIQSSNQYEITTRVGVGEIYGRKALQGPVLVRHVIDGDEPDWDDIECPINEAENGDTLWLTHDHVPKMRKWLEANKHICDPAFRASMSWDKVQEKKTEGEETAFWEMVKAYANYIDNNPNDEEFWFDGEY